MLVYSGSYHQWVNEVDATASSPAPEQIDAIFAPVLKWIDNEFPAIPGPRKFFNATPVPIPPWVNEADPTAFASIPGNVNDFDATSIPVPMWTEDPAATSVPASEWVNSFASSSQVGL